MKPGAVYAQAPWFDQAIYRHSKSKLKFFLCLMGLISEGPTLQENALTIRWCRHLSTLYFSTL